MSLLSDLLGDCSPYIYNLVYDIDARMLFIECLDDPDSDEPALRVVFPEITSFREANRLNQFDDETMDDIVDMNRGEGGSIVIVTYKKEITIELTGEPFSEEID